MPTLFIFNIEKMKISFIPKTHLGKWSVLLIMLFFALLGLFFLLVASGERGGETFFSNLKLTIPMLIAGISGVCSFALGLISIIKNRERSIFVFIATIIGFFILYWILAEILFPH